VKEELPEDEKSNFWQSGVLLYSIGLPFVWVSMIVFYAMPNMQKDVSCSLAMMASTAQMEDDTLLALQITNDAGALVPFSSMECYKGAYPIANVIA
jgi:hypothetical protein